MDSFEKELEESEERHPDTPIKDLLDTKKLLPETTPFAKKINQLKKNLVTITQTSGCLCFHRNICF
jgi:hypothetical protein